MKRTLCGSCVIQINFFVTTHKKESQMVQNKRRVFMMQVAAGASVLALGHQQARAAEKLSANDAYAKSMGFVLNTKDVDQKRWKRHTVEQQCSKCQLWDGKPTDAYAACSFFGDRHTPAAGWCKNFKIQKA
jgi:hypothetical protein